MRIEVGRVLLALLILSAFAPFAIMLDTDDLFTLLDAVAVCIGIGVIWAYLTGAYHSLSAPRTTAAHLLVLGIAATWTAAVGRLAWLWAWRLMGRPDPFFDHWIVAFSVYLFIIGGSLHLIANRAIDDEIPPSGWATLLAFGSLGVVLGVGLAWWM